MDQNSVISLAEKYAELVAQVIPIKKVYLFGSYVKGTADKDSDIDVAVIVEEIKGDFLAPRVKLVELTHLVDIRIEPILLEEKKNRSGFIDTVIRTGRQIYPRLS